jgi:hypothetical protein
VRAFVGLRERPDGATIAAERVHRVRANIAVPASVVDGWTFPVVGSTLPLVGPVACRVRLFDRVRVVGVPLALNARLMQEQVLVTLRRPDGDRLRHRLPDRCVGGNHFRFEVPEGIPSSTLAAGLNAWLDHLPLQLAHLLEAAVARVAEHDVVHEIDAHHHAGRRQPPRQLVIVRTRRGIP